MGDKPTKDLGASTAARRLRGHKYKTAQADRESSAGPSGSGKRHPSSNKRRGVKYVKPRADRTYGAPVGKPLVNK